MENTKHILSNQFKRRGLGAAVAAGLVCHEAERLYPDLFRAVSLKQGVLHVVCSQANLIAFKLVEGKLLADLQTMAKAQGLPIPDRIRLTFPRESDNV